MELLGNVNMDSHLKWLIWKISPEGTHLAVMPELRVLIFGSSTEYKRDLSNLTINWRNGAIKMESI